MINSLLTFYIMLGSCYSYCQSSFPVIQTSVNEIDVRDEKGLNKGEWFLAPEIKPDVYVSNNIGETVTFYTDRDSISFLIHPDSVYNFVFYNGVDSSYTQVKYEPSFLDVLKEANEYNLNEPATFPVFTYQDSSDQNLRDLRTGFNLDSIAGNGDEFSRLLNVMHWLHDLIPHDGSKENPVVKNAMSMIGTCNSEQRGLNCRGLAIVLNECYLALGYKSRYVTCMPKDSVFNDCHVINTVYSVSLGKWIWLDPTHDAYVMDENGIPLSIEEVRQRLIEDKPLTLNPTANWNHQEPTVAEYHLYEYMAKNLYRLECPLHSQYNYETGKKGSERIYVELLPLDGFNQFPKFSEGINKKLKYKWKMYKTNNSELFWAKP